MNCPIQHDHDAHLVSVNGGEPFACPGLDSDSSDPRETPMRFVVVVDVWRRDLEALDLDGYNLTRDDLAEALDARLSEVYVGEGGLEVRCSATLLDDDLFPVESSVAPDALEPLSESESLAIHNSKG